MPGEIDIPCKIDLEFPGAPPYIKNMETNSLWLAFENARAARDAIVTYGSAADFARTSARFLAADVACNAARLAYLNAVAK